MKIFNATKNGDADRDLSQAINFAGRNAYVKVFGFGEWYGNSVAVVAISSSGKTAVIEWQRGYVRGAKKWVEASIHEFIESQEE